MRIVDANAVDVRDVIDRTDNVTLLACPRWAGAQLAAERCLHEQEAGCPLASVCTVKADPQVVAHARPVGCGASGSAGGLHQCATPRCHRRTRAEYCDGCRRKQHLRHCKWCDQPFSRAAHKQTETCSHKCKSLLREYRKQSHHTGRALGPSLMYPQRVSR